MNSFYASTFGGHLPPFFRGHFNRFFHLGKSRLYQCLPQEDKKRLPQLLMTDTQINLVARAYYQDEVFGVDAQSREISMWKVYNLLTGTNKSSYIDNFLDRALNASQLAEGINKALSGESEYRWFVE